MKNSGNNDIHFKPFLLSHFLRTLSLILNSSGRSTLSLPQMTSEFWDLLLSLRTRSGSDTAVLEALLFGFLTLLDINDNKRTIAERHSKALIETQEWADMVMTATVGGDKEGDQIKMLAAGVVMRCREVVEKYQRLLMGDMI